LDAVLGADSTVGCPLFVAATAIAKKDRENFTRDDAIIAQDGESRIFGQLDLSLAVGADASSCRSGTGVRQTRGAFRPR
jgi:hypothetical protein